MSSRDEAIRRVLLWAAMLATGIGLVGLQFGCSMPQTLLAAPGFPHASRLASPTIVVGVAPSSPSGIGTTKTGRATATNQGTPSTLNPRTISTTLNPSVTAQPNGREVLPTHEPIIASVNVVLP